MQVQRLAGQLLNAVGGLLMTDEFGNRNGLPQINGDSPAFPVNVSGCGDNGWHGMSLRDWFAGQALANEALGRAYHNTPKALALHAYEYADAMLIERALPSQDRAK